MSDLFFEHANFYLRRQKEYTQRYFYSITNKGGRKRILWDFFILANTFLRDLEIDYWVTFGTLLGFYREAGIMKHDRDIDFACDESCYSLLMDNRYKLDPKIRMYDTSYRHYGPKLYLSYKGFDADIYFYRHENGKLYSYEKTRWENYNTPIPCELVFPTRHQTVNGVKTRVPDKMEEYLTFIFGNLSPDAVRNDITGYWE